MLFSVSLLAAAVACQNALEVVAGSAVHKTLAGLVTTLPDIANLLKGTSNLTLFAPTDDAFKALNTNSPDTYKAVTSNNTLLAQVLTYHVLPGVVFDPAIAKARNFVKTGLAASTLRADVALPAVTLYFGLGKAMVTSSAKVSNGVVHIIDAVMTPPMSASKTAVAAGLTRLVAALTKVKFVETVDGAKDITILAPTNAAFEALDAFAAANNLTITDAILSAVLNLHIIPGTAYSTDLVGLPQPLSLKSAYNEVAVTGTANAEGVKLSGPDNKTPGTVTTADVLIEGGVVHVIDTVLLPTLSTIKAGAIIPPTLPSSSKPQATGLANSAVSIGASLLSVMLFCLN